jgi:tetratricopeptide (TPR) repeat protein
MNKREYDKALTESDKVVELNPELAEGWAFAGTLHEKQGDIETAMKYYKKSIQVFDQRISDPEKKDRIRANRLSRAFSLVLLGKENEGKEEMRKLKAEKPNDLMVDELLKMSKKEYMDEMFQK